MVKLLKTVSYADYLLRPFVGIESFRENAEEIIKKKKILDFNIAVGRIYAKFQDENSKMHLLEIQGKSVSEDCWQVLFQELAEKSLFLACLLNAEMPEEIMEIFIKINFFPSTISDYKFLYNFQEQDELNLYLAALLFKFAAAVEKDPFLVFLFLGKGKEEVLLEIKRARECKHYNYSIEEKKNSNNGKIDDFILTKEGLQNFWKVNEQIFTLSYSLKADDLPAALLKRLDPLPIAGIEEDADRILEDAYAYIAKRSQAYGLGLK